MVTDCNVATLDNPLPRELRKLLVALQNNCCLAVITKIARAFCGHQLVRNLDKWCHAAPYCQLIAEGQIIPVDDLGAVLPDACLTHTLHIDAPGPWLASHDAKHLADRRVLQQHREEPKSFRKGAQHGLVATKRNPVHHQRRPLQSRRVRATRHKRRPRVGHQCSLGLLQAVVSSHQAPSFLAQLRGFDSGHPHLVGNHIGVDWEKEATR
mmetsp:Transcript_87523/g.245833  ORF Transcript_87523/g.245833 Transcript_87523/m.245833 type:complete len:210 (-) Transcript_87523:566-1195(-)